jgi:hypothetical protein
LKRSFKNQAFWSKTQHTLFNTCSPLIILYFDIRNWPVVRLKQLCLWFFVSILIFAFEYIIWWHMIRWFSVNFKETGCPSQKLRIYQEKLFFWAPILSACIITSSLIHEATTLMEKLFKFWERHLLVQIVYLIKKKKLLKACNAGYGSWLWKIEIS